jgi:hypothetical protein
MSGKWLAGSDVGVSVSVETFSRLEAFLDELSLAGPFGSLGEMSLVDSGPEWRLAHPIGQQNQ